MSDTEEYISFEHKIIDDYNGRNQKVIDIEIYLQNYGDNVFHDYSVRAHVPRVLLIPGLNYSTEDINQSTSTTSVQVINPSTVSIDRAPFYPAGSKQKIGSVQIVEKSNPHEIKFEYNAGQKRGVLLVNWNVSLGKLDVISESDEPSKDEPTAKLDLSSKNESQDPLADLRRKLLSIHPSFPIVILIVAVVGSAAAFYNNILQAAVNTMAIFPSAVDFISNSFGSSEQSHTVTIDSSQQSFIDISNLKNMVVLEPGVQVTLTHKSGEWTVSTDKSSPINKRVGPVGNYGNSYDFERRKVKHDNNLIAEDVPFGSLVGSSVSFIPYQQAVQSNNAELLYELEKQLKERENLELINFKTKKLVAGPYKEKRVVLFKINDDEYGDNDGSITMSMQKSKPVIHKLFIAIPPNVAPQRQGFWIRIKDDKDQSDIRFVKDSVSKIYLEDENRKLNFPNGDSSKAIKPGRYEFWIASSKNLSRIKFVSHASNPNIIVSSDNEDYPLQSDRENFNFLINY